MSVAARSFGLAVNGKDLVRNATFDAPARGLVLLEGPSGSGKSTLLAAIAGLFPNGNVETRGALDVLGRDAALGPHAPDAVAFVPQDPRDALLAADVLGEVAFRLENLGVPEEEGLARARDALARLGLASMECRESATLSGGEARRVAIASALAARPRVALFDEPFAGLDAAWRARVADDLAELAREACVVVAEHRTAPLAPRADVRVHLGGNDGAP